MSYLIYSIEDDLNIANIIRITLLKQGYDVVSFQDGNSFLKAFNEKKPDLILLDIMLPDIDGLSLLKKIKEDKSNNDIRIIILSAKSMTIDKVEGLDLGADDYISKPFDILELISRVNALKRRQEKDYIYHIKNVILDVKKRKCYINDDEIILTKKEFDVLAFLFTHHDEVVSREDIIKYIWNGNFEYETRTIDMHIQSLRKKLKDEGKIIETVYGIGYMINL